VEHVPPRSDPRTAALVEGLGQATSAAPEHTGRSPTRSLAELLSYRPPRFVHAHPPVRNINALLDAHLTWGQRVADWVAATMGSWRFIILQSVLLAVWIVLNVVGWREHWDPYPFILLNLVLSFQAAYAAPIIMMSQNRQAEKDRLAAQHDYDVNVKAEEEIKAILDHLEYQHELTLQLLARLERQDAQLLAMVRAQAAGSPDSPTASSHAPPGASRGAVDGG
jgi:uncharacterized membrane protein